jgi:hypothetical protein
MMATMPTTSAISEERFLSEVSSKLDAITYVFAPKLPGSLVGFDPVEGKAEKIPTHHQHGPGSRTVFLLTGVIRQPRRNDLPTRRAAQLLQLIADGTQQGVAVNAALHPWRELV